MECAMCGQEIGTENFRGYDADCCSLRCAFLHIFQKTMLEISFELNQIKEILQDRGRDND